MNLKVLTALDAFSSPDRVALATLEARRWQEMAEERAESDRIENRDKPNLRVLRQFIRRRVCRGTMASIAWDPGVRTTTDYGTTPPTVRACVSGYITLRSGQKCGTASIHFFCQLSNYSTLERLCGRLRALVLADHKQKGAGQ